uniref:HtpX-like membrane-bound metallopeptidase n=1 Tax=Marseillevirus LCMAC103 TaxID=2506604 RepID=A0A481YVG6_9VIRU|nr:MAG: HtpX-like membrane-bound metallopeptidase [Marseillevirus LCMAC103]
MKGPNNTGVFVTVVVLALFAVLLVAVMQPHRDDTAHEPMLGLVRANFTRLSPAYAAIPLLAGRSAYTDNKAVITLCLSDPKTGEPYDDNTIMYVALHELGHVITTSVGHGREFRKNFSNLLARASNYGFYDSTKPIVATYCGVKG